MTVGRAACRVDFLVTTQVTSPQDQRVMSVSRRMRVPFKDVFPNGAYRGISHGHVTPPHPGAHVMGAM